MLDKLKDKKKISIIAICVIAIVFVFLLTRAFEPEEVGDNFADYYESFTAASNSDISNIAGHLYKEYSDSFTADVDIPVFDGAADILTAEYSSFDEDLLLSIFMDDINATRGLADNAVFYRSLDDSKYLYITNKSGSFIYENSITKYYKFATENFMTEYEYTTQANMLPRYDTVYKAENLSFMSADEAVAYVKTVLDKLSINVSDNVEMYAIDYQTMQEYQDKMKIEEPDAAVNYTLKDTFTESDEFYILCFTVVQDNLPVTHSSYDTLSTYRTVTGANIRVHLSSSGIIYFEATGIYNVKAVDSTPASIISPQDAIDKVFEIHDSIVSTDIAKVTKISLEYSLIPYNDNYSQFKLVPSWCVTLLYDYGIGIDVYETKAINAVTGEEIK